MTTTETIHLHDLGILISVGDLEPVQLTAIRRRLEAEVGAMVERINAETAELTGQMVAWSVNFDGSRECAYRDEHR